jgi:ABC-type multidrug transport system ATPase subunit
LTIRTHDLGKRFNREWIFKKFTYQFSAGTIYAITGPNGSGKSTLISVLSGHVPPSIGSLTYENTDGSKISEEDIFKHVAMAAPYMDLIDEFTVEEHLEFHFKLKPIKAGLSVEDILGLSYLQNARKKYVLNLSSGMKQRLRLAMAFFSEYQILLLDEPATNLDAKALAWYQGEIARVQPDSIILIASNNDFEYPPNSEFINVLDFKS